MLTCWSLDRKRGVYLRSVRRACPEAPVPPAYEPGQTNRLPFSTLGRAAIDWEHQTIPRLFRLRIFSGVTSAKKDLSPLARQQMLLSPRERDSASIIHLQNTRFKTISLHRSAKLLKTHRVLREVRIKTLDLEFPASHVSTVAARAEHPAARMNPTNSKPG